MSQAASKADAFWALLTIALGSVTQRSFTGRIFSGDTFGDPLWPHRSSPLVCLADTAVEIRFLIRDRHDLKTRGGDPPPARPTVNLMRLAICVLGVLPQAIYLFSIRGIPLIQTIAAVFLLSQITNTLVSHEREREREEKEEVAGPSDATSTTTLKSRQRDGIIGREADTAELSPLPVALTSTGLALHVVALHQLWVSIAANWRFGWTDPRAPRFLLLVQCAFWASACPVVALMVFLASRHPSRHQRLRRLVWSPGARAFTFCFWGPGVLAPGMDLILPPAPSGFPQRYLSGSFLFLWFAVVCFYVARVFCVVARNVSTVLGSCFGAVERGESESADGQGHEMRALPAAASEMPLRPGSCPPSLGSLPARQRSSNDVANVEASHEGPRDGNYVGRIADDGSIPVQDALRQTSGATMDGAVAGLESVPQAGAPDARLAEDREQHARATHESSSPRSGLATAVSAVRDAPSVDILSKPNHFVHMGNGWMDGDHDVAWMTFGLVNFVTMVFAFLVLVDTSKTVSPDWSGLFS